MDALIAMGELHFILLAGEFCLYNGNVIMYILVKVAKVCTFSYYGYLSLLYLVKFNDWHF